MLCAVGGMRIKGFDIFIILTCSSAIRGFCLLGLSDFSVATVRYFWEDVLLLLN